MIMAIDEIYSTQNVGGTSIEEVLFMLNNDF